jgi:hypothetical protein
MRKVACCCTGKNVASKISRCYVMRTLLFIYIVHFGRGFTYSRNLVRGAIMVDTVPQLSKIHSELPTFAKQLCRDIT